ncbi:rad, Gem/Kir family member 3 isoform X2 [Oratosquilla oratoria]|uniref:rad, Gem/Kir family member 3 isoform X2 n=1 Tax=Oratosquilla oratoria TaxID=337810 RepID=UPI003F7613FA
MTVVEADLARMAAEKGRSASFCVPGQLPFSLQASRSSSDLHMDGTTRAHAYALAHLQQQHQEAVGGSQGSVGMSRQSPRTRLKTAQAARRSQSCRVQGSRPPRVRRRAAGGSPTLGYDLSTGSTSALSGGREGGETPTTASSAAAAAADGAEDSYNPFLKKVPSCGKLLTLTAEGTDTEFSIPEDSPHLMRSASARRPRPPTGHSPNHSPTPTRSTRLPQKGRSTVKKTVTATTSSGGGSTRRSGGTTSYLDVKPSSSAEGLDSEGYLLRNFTTTKGSIINRGDSFRRRRSRSNSIVPPDSAITPVSSLASPPTTPDHALTPEEAGSPEESFRVAIVGATGVGKTALIQQFMTSECINAYDCHVTGDENESSVSIVLNSIESELNFINITTPKEILDEAQRVEGPNGWVIVYSITDRSSFQRASEELTKLQGMGALRGKAIVIVANKCELVRSRAVPVDDGRDLACSYGAKFMEISVGMNHKCDDLLVGVLNQLRLKDEAALEQQEFKEKEKSPWTRNKSLMRASLKAKRVINRIMGKTDTKYKNCEDFNTA